jgi:CubicO group peptidase (beta-lactamase class C family)
MNHPLFISLITILLALTLLSCEKDDGPEPGPVSITTTAELTDALHDIYSDTEVPGFAVSVVKNDALLYQETFGMADIETQVNYHNQTVQPIGSISKTFVAAAIVKAIEEGYFTLETPINDLLPLEVINPKQPNAVIRVKHLVTHTSGLIDHYEAYFQGYHIVPGEDLSTEGAALFQAVFDMQQRETLPLEDFLAAYYLADGSLYSTDNFAATAPGAAWNYSNVATSLAAYLVEVATGIPFRSYVETNILQPLGMSNTAYGRAGLDEANFAKLYWDKHTPLPAYYNDSYPDGGIMTCNEDLAKYLMDMMKGAKGQSTTLFSKTGYDLLFNASLPDGKVPAAFAQNQGVFWFLDDQLIRHDGSDPGTACNLLFDKATDSGYLLLTNMDASTDAHEEAYFQLSGKVNDAIAAFIRNN